jgi:hypothetical protein
LMLAFRIVSNGELIFMKLQAGACNNIKAEAQPQLNEAQISTLFTQFLQILPRLLISQF